MGGNGNRTCSSFVGSMASQTEGNDPGRGEAVGAKGLIADETCTLPPADPAEGLGGSAKAVEVAGGKIGGSKGGSRPLARAFISTDATFSATSSGRCPSSSKD